MMKQLTNGGLVQSNAFHVREQNHQCCARKHCHDRVTSAFFQ